MTNIVEQTIGKIADGHRPSYVEAISLAARLSVGELCEIAAGLRKLFHGTDFDTCSIMNARSGRCSEDCKWCSQSKFHNTDIEIYPLIGTDEAVAMARHNESKGVRRFSLVTSGRAMTDAEVDKACEIFREIGRQTKISLCASMGLLSGEQLKKLYDSGVRRYHCNLETAPSHFPQLCTTHTAMDKIETILRAREAGMEVCSGGIIGMGESIGQRIEFAVTLRELGVMSMPINILNPIPGTLLENMTLLHDDEILLSMAMMRIVNPEAHIRLAGGRSRIKHLERRLLHCGVSASIVGDMLTTAGTDIDSDRRMFVSEGFSL